MSWNHTKSIMIGIERQYIFNRLHQLILFKIQFHDISKHHSLSLVMSYEFSCSQLHRFSFELIGTTFIYAIIVYLITETLPQLKLSFCVSC